MKIMVSKSQAILVYITDHGKDRRCIYNTLDDLPQPTFNNENIEIILKDELPSVDTRPQIQRKRGE